MTFFIVSVNLKERAKDLPCIFAELIEKYSKVGLKPCETKESQKWRHASYAAERLALYHNQFPELSDLHSFLESYSICERHYNQIIANNNFFQRLTGSGQENKRIRVSADEDNTPIPVSQPNIFAELDRVRRLLEYYQWEDQRKLQLVTDLNNQLARMRQQLEDQKNEIEELKEQLQKAYNNMSRSLQQRELNRNLIERWNSRYDSHQKRMQAVVDIAEIERKSLYEDIKSLIECTADRFY
jgi:signal transduction histidine kinase